MGEPPTVENTVVRTTSFLPPGSRPWQRVLAGAWWTPPYSRKIRVTSTERSAEQCSLKRSGSVWRCSVAGPECVRASQVRVRSLPAGVRLVPGPRRRRAGRPARRLPARLLVGKRALRGRRRADCETARASGAAYDDSCRGPGSGRRPGLRPGRIQSCAKLLRGRPVHAEPRCAASTACFEHGTIGRYREGQVTRAWPALRRSRHIWPRRRLRG